MLPLMVFAGAVSILSVAAGVDLPTVRVMESSGAPVAIETASTALDENATSIVRFAARNVGHSSVSDFRVRVYVVEGSRKPRGLVTKVLGGALAPGDVRAYDVSLASWYVGKGDRLSIAVSHVRTASGSWQAHPGVGRAVVVASPGAVTGDWLDDAGVQPQQGCPAGFCSYERQECLNMCGAGCIYSFYCKAIACESSCVCKTTPACEGH